MDYLQLALKLISGILPENIILRSLVETLLIFALILALGCAVALINWVLSWVFAMIIGSIPTFLLMNFVTYPGTVHHELSHALLIFLTGGRLRKICLVPSPTTLGHVEFNTRGNIFFRSLQLSLSAVAPVLCGLVTEVLLFTYVYPNVGLTWQKVLFFYLAISIFVHLTLSIQDLINFFQ
ncbi:MAG: hypothetical protein J5966_08985, partial [Lachnospiraceae bacterium]|nr:hypothetical protein [Lachnospiraceae bacterium]